MTCGSDPSSIDVRNPSSLKSTHTYPKTSPNSSGIFFTVTGQFKPSLELVNSIVPARLNSIGWLRSFKFTDERSSFKTSPDEFPEKNIDVPVASVTV